LQYLDFAAAINYEQLQLQIENLQQQGLLLPEQAKTLDITRLLHFCESELGRRFASATKQLREVSFTYTLPVGELLPDSEFTDRVILQGMLDAAFWEGDGWVLLDYKTGGFGKTDYELKELYARQLGYYRRALADLWQAPVKESWLCFVDLERNIRLD
jgi:ATP-dependent helicase/nuclease subunit A